jgi:hypothetical protein
MRTGKLVAVVVATTVFLVTTNTYGDNRLLPADMLDPGRFFSQLSYIHTASNGKLTFAGEETGLKSEEHRIQLSFGFGVTNALDVEIAVPYVATATSRLKENTVLGLVEMSTYTEGLDDTQFHLRLRLADEKTSDVNILFSLIGVFPSGERKDGQPRLKLDGVELQDYERDYPGEGVISYGAGFAASGPSGRLEPYVAGSYIFGGRRIRHHIKEHYADEALLQAGLQMHAGPQVTFDFCLLGIYNSSQTYEEDRDRVREDPFLIGGISLAAHLEFAPNVTFIIGAAYTMIESYQIDRDADIKMKDTKVVRMTVAFHILF